MSSTNAIYYTEKFYAILVQIIKTDGDRACIQTKSGKLFNVCANRLVAVLAPSSSVRAGRVTRTQPSGYSTILEHCHANNFKIDHSQLHRIAVLCGWECRTQQTSVWRGKHQIAYYPATIIDVCYKKMISENKQPKNLKNG